MTWLANKLNKRVVVQRPTQTANDFGGATRGYEDLLTIWASVLPVDQGLHIQGSQAVIANVEMPSGGMTHEIKVRRLDVQNLGAEFSSAFDGSFASMSDLIPLKGDYFIFMRQGSSVKGRRFRVGRVADDGERREFLRILAEELEEAGTGY
jgi:head-tail adaptor